MRIESTDALITARDVQRIPIQNSSKGQKQHVETEDKSNSAQLSEKTIINTIEKANNAIIIAQRQLEFSIHEKTKEILVKVIDTGTGEVIREIPPEKILDMVANMLEMAGILVDERR